MFIFYSLSLKFNLLIEMFLWFVFIFAYCAHGSIVIFERWDTAGCNVRRVEPNIFPMLNLNFNRVNAQSATDTSLVNDFAGVFIQITETSVTFLLSGGTNVTHAPNVCIEHPAFSFGMFKVIPGPAIAGIVRRRQSGINGGSDDLRPNSGYCTTRGWRDTFNWFTQLHYPIQLDPVDSAVAPCPSTFQEKNVYYYQNNRNIASCRFSQNRNNSPIGCFNETDPAVHSCASQFKCTCHPDTSCTAPPRLVFDNSITVLPPFISSYYGSLESVRLVRDNTFPFDLEPTSSSSTSSSATIVPLLTLVLALFIN